MLTQKRRKELWGIVREAFPKIAVTRAEEDFNFDEAVFDSSFEGASSPIWSRVSKDPTKILSCFANKLEELNSCCGFLELAGLELMGLEEWERALFILWVNQRVDPDDTCVGLVATTAAHPSTKTWTEEELLLKEAGFQPTIRGENRNSGNFCTLWVFQTSRPTMIKEKTTHATNRAASPRRKR